jgi:hypothetical protein
LTALKPFARGGRSVVLILSTQNDRLRERHHMNWLKGFLLAAVAGALAFVLSGCAP